MSTATLEPTEAEVLAAMRDGDGGDFFQTKARLERERTIAERKQPANAGDAAPWRVAPRPEEIAAEMHLHGLSYADARAQLCAAMAADARRLADASPQVGEEIKCAVVAATAAQEKADTLIAENEAVLQSLESAIYALAQVRRQIRRIESLRLGKAAAKHLADTAMDFFLAKEGTGQTIQNESGWRVCVEELAFRSVLNPFVGDYAAALQSKAAALVSEIRAEAAKGKIDLKNFLAVLASERRKGLPGASLDMDATLFADLVE